MAGTVLDASPLNYLICIDAIGILPRLYEGLCIPKAVHVELSHPKAPIQVRGWIQQRHEWLSVIGASNIPHNLSHARLGSGECEAIGLALELKADLLIVDDRDAAIVARDMGISTVGTLAVLDQASEKGWIDLADAFLRLAQTSFRSPGRLMIEMLKQDAQRKQKR